MSADPGLRVLLEVGTANRRYIVTGVSLLMVAAGLGWQLRHSRLSVQDELPSRSVGQGVHVPAGQLPGTFAGLQSGARKFSVERLKGVARKEKQVPAARSNDAVAEEEQAREHAVNLIRQLAARDPKAAAASAEKMPAGGIRSEALSAVAIEWAGSALDEAVRWVKTLPDGDERNDVLKNVAYEAARTEPAKAIELAMELPAGEERDDLIKHAALQWAAASPSEAANWANEQIQDVLLRDRVLANIATAWGEDEPVAAATFALLAITPGRALDDAVIGIVQRWAQKDPEAAAEWVSSFPASGLAETAAENLLRLWPEAGQGMQSPEE